MTGTGTWDHIPRAVAGTTDQARFWDGARYVSGPFPAAPPTAPWAVHLFDDRQRVRTLAFDLDAHGTDTASVEEDLRTLTTLLSLASARYAVFRSGPSGGFHVFVPFQRPLSFAAARSIAVACATHLRSLDVSCLCNPSTGAIRPPGAPHRAGGTSEPVSPLQLAVFDDPNEPSVLAALLDVLDLPPGLARPPSPPLSPRLFAVLHSGTGLERYESLSEVVMALATSVLSRGHRPEWLLEALTDERHELTRRLTDHRRRDGSRRDARRLVISSLERARQFVEMSPAIASRDETFAELDIIEHCAASRQWAGRTGLTDRAVLAAHLTIARRCGGLVHNASQRQIAEGAHVATRTTVERAHRRLVAAGFLVLVRNGSATSASTWRIRRPRDAAALLLAEAPSQLRRLGVVNHPVFAWNELGKAAASVLDAVMAGDTSPGQIAARTGLHQGTVRRSAARLRDVGLLTAADRRLGRVVGLDELVEVLDRAADDSGASARHCELVRRHEVERQLWTRWLAAVAAARAGPQAA